MAASVLNSERAVHASVFVVRAFVALREMLHAHKELARKLGELEQKYDGQFAIVFDAIRDLVGPLKRHRTRRIGFRPPKMPSKRKTCQLNEELAK